MSYLAYSNIQQKSYPTVTDNRYMSLVSDYLNTGPLRSQLLKGIWYLDDRYLLAAQRKSLVFF